MKNGECSTLLWGRRERELEKGAGKGEYIKHTTDSGNWMQSISQQDSFLAKIAGTSFGVSAIAEFCEDELSSCLS